MSPPRAGFADPCAMLSPSAAHRKIFWSLQIGGWLALTAAFLTVNLLVVQSPAAALFNGLFRQAVGFALTLGLAGIYRHWRWDSFSLWRHGAAVLGLSLLAMAVDLGTSQAARTLLQIQVVPTTQRTLQLAASIGRTLVYGGWSAIYLSLKFFFELRDRDLRLTRAEIAARDAELKSLRAQLNPHFLFNALNSILAEADDNPARVKAITLSLSDLLRFSLRQHEHLGPLGAEIDAIENYLKVERSRFEERLDWQVDVSPVAREATVPTSLLLPLVENAIKYGLQTSPTHLRIRVGATVSDGRINAFVENSGRWIEPDPTLTRSTGIGLNNLRRRLALLCGPDGRVEISFPDSIVRVDLHVPVAGARSA
ncbi:MAG TPA: histidine kinase [Opitutus sp.]|nr:histidine kinase [Opitutus sp.]